MSVNVIDTNIFISALIRKGIIREILINSDINFLFPEFELEEIYNRKPCPFPAGSMGPKVKAVIEFLKGGGQVAYITKTELFDETLKGKAGTTVVR